MLIYWLVKTLGMWRNTNNKCRDKTSDTKYMATENNSYTLSLCDVDKQEKAINF